MSAIHPDLALARFLPSVPIGQRVVRLLQRARQRTVAPPDGVVVADVAAAPCGCAFTSRRRIATRPRPRCGCTEPRVRQVVDGVLDGLAGTAEVDLGAAVARPVPVAVVFR